MNWTRTFARIVLIICLLALTTLCLGCLGTKKVTEKTNDTKSIEKVEKSSDSVKKETVNKGISDAVTVEIPVSDPMVDAKIDEILRKLNTSKSSGDNSYRLYYDEQLRELRAEFEVGETKSSEIATNTQSNTEKSFEQTVTENTKKVIRMVPWWAWVIAFFLFFRQIMNIVGIVYPPARGINSIADLFTNPNRNGNN